MNGARLNLRDSARIRRFLDQVDPSIRGGVYDQAVESIARLTEQRAKEIEIVRGRGKDSPPLTSRLSFRTGRLTRSISTDVSQRPRLFVVGSTVAYAPVHELGLGPYPKRAFLEPAAEFIINNQGPGVFRKALERARGRR